MEQRTNKDELEIDLREIAGVLLSRWLFIVLMACLFGVLAFLYSRMTWTPQYSSTTSIYVINQQNADTLTSADLQTGSQLTNDYRSVVRSRSVLEQVIYTLNLNLSYEQLLGKVTVNNPEDTRILEITVTDPDPYEAKRLADGIREAATDKIIEVMNIDAVNLLEEGNIPRNSTGSPVRRTTAIGVVLGGVLSVGIVVLHYLLNDSIRTPEDVERYLGLSTLGIIPLDPEKEKQNRRNQKLSKKAERRRRKDRSKPESKR